MCGDDSTSLLFRTSATPPPAAATPCGGPGSELRLPYIASSVTEYDDPLRTSPSNCTPPLTEQNHAGV